MVALSHDDFVLALFPGSPTPGSLYEICLGLEADRVDALGARLPDGAEVVKPDGGGDDAREAFEIGDELELTGVAAGLFVVALIARVVALYVVSHDCGLSRRGRSSG